MRVAVVHLSPGLVLSISIFSACTYGQLLCAAISAILIRPNVSYATCYKGLFFDMRVSTSLISIISVPLFHKICKPSEHMVYNSDNFNICNALVTPQSIQKNDGVVSNNGNVVLLQITNQNVLTVMLSVLLLLCPTVCCTRIQWVCLTDSISIQFVANRLQPANCC